MVERLPPHMRNVFLRAKPTRFGSLPSGSTDTCIPKAMTLASTG